MEEEESSNDSVSSTVLSPIFRQHSELSQRAPFDEVFGRSPNGKVEKRMEETQNNHYR